MIRTFRRFAMSVTHKPERPFRFNVPSVEASGFSLPCALSLAHASSLAYVEEEEKLREVLESQRLKLLGVFRQENIQAILFEAGRRWILAFRGSQETRDWIINLKITQSSLQASAEGATPSAVEVHTGFQEGLDLVWSAVREKLQTMPAETQLVFTGHSLGGALATIAAHRFPDSGRVGCIYTFGQPLVGNGSFAREMFERYGEKFFRFVNNRDIVTRIPPPPGIYRHCGMRCFIDEEGSFDEPEAQPAFEALGAEDPADQPITEAEWERLRESLSDDQSAGDGRLEFLGLESLIQDHYLKGGYIPRLAELAGHGQTPEIEHRPPPPKAEENLANFANELEAILKEDPTPEEMTERKGRIELWAGKLLDWLGKGEAADAETAASILQKLKSHRFYTILLSVGKGFLVRNSLVADASVRLPYAQALIEEKHFDVAAGFLATTEFEAKKALEEAGKDDKHAKKMWTEAAGLLGRVSKQWYIDDPSLPEAKAGMLAASVAWYGHVFDKYPEDYWHGINLAALLVRASKDGVDSGRADDPKTIAKRVFDTCEAYEKKGPWEHASMGEALLARGDIDGAAKHIRAYVEHQDVDAFQIAGTLRQFEEVWQLGGDNADAVALIDLMRAALILKQEGEFQQSVDELRFDTGHVEERGARLQKIFGASYQSARWMFKFQNRARMVGRVWKRDDRGIGTGFLIKDASVLHPGWQGPIFVTCFHVVNTAGKFGALRPENAQITFDVGDPHLPPHRFDIAEILWESPPDPEWSASGELIDTACLRLKNAELALQMIDDLEVAAVVDSDRLPSEPKDDRIYIIGHPYGGDLSFTFQDNHLVACHDKATRIRYYSSASPGSSGSPLFDENLNLIGMHHAGGELPNFNERNVKKACNQGIPLPAMLSAIAEAKPGDLSTFKI